ncbi:restriction endonuclease [Mycobacterium sp. 852002-51613_SCH5001154]|uniref:restriction endonuclease n=1 Tax=Mycobacterium sp. 852002-51613_SCH5001154 TaxID=1834104 RepID=UPI000B2D7529|nr:restriction endonuclease [Mycobacterium sp. 852002-51613_SCH5001154]
MARLVVAHPYDRGVLKALVVLPLACGVVVGVVDHSPGMAFAAFYLMLLLEVLVGWSTNRQWPRGGRAVFEAVDAMDGVEFEGYVAARLRRAGWRVTFTPPVGDYGVDLIAEKDGHSVAVQCKRHGKSVGIAAVQQVVSGARHHGCVRSIVVSNQEFTRAAKQLAHTHGCQLIGRKVLQAWVPPPAWSAKNPAGRKSAQPASE